MLRFLVDENFNNKIVTGLLRLKPDVELLRVQDTALPGKDDPSILGFAAENSLVLLTHDSSTMPMHAYTAIAAGQKMPGIVLVASRLPIARAIEGVLLINECVSEAEIERLIIRLPL